MAGTISVREKDLDLTNGLYASYSAATAGDTDLAISSLTGLGPAGSSSYFVQLRLGWLYYGSQEWQKSELCYERASQLAPEAIEPLLGLMLPLQASGNLDHAMKIGEAVVRKDSCNYTALSRMAWIQYSKKEYVHAVMLYQKLVDLYPTDTEMLLGLGYALLFKGEEKNAASCFRQVLLLSPDNERALSGLASAEAPKDTSAAGSGVPKHVPGNAPKHPPAGGGGGGGRR
jgi:tetratricopeptide (TPR) repeat protein